MDEHFKTLGLSPDADRKEVIEAYKALVKVWHPDRFSKDSSLRQEAEENLKRINQAYEEIQAYCEDPSNRKKKATRKKRTSAPRRPSFDPGTAKKSRPVNRTSRTRSGWRWLWFLLPLIGITAFRSRGKRQSIDIDNTSAKTVVVIIFLLYSALFLAYILFAGGGLEVVLYWLVLLLYVIRKYNIKLDSPSQKTALIYQLNILCTVLFLLLLTKGLLWIM